jgi:nucleoside-diphosphate kinase
MNASILKIKKQQTFVMIKPDGVMRGLVGEIVSRMEKKGLKIVALKMLKATRTKLEEHYPLQDEAWIERLGDKGISAFESIGVDVVEVLGTNNKLELGKKVSSALIEYMLSGPVVCMVIEGIQAVDIVRKLVGSTLPSMADIGTIRGDYSFDFPPVGLSEGRALHNLIHASEFPHEADDEMKIWFDQDEIISYELGNDKIMYSKFY